MTQELLLLSLFLIVNFKLNKENGSLLNKGIEWKEIQLSRDHKPNLEDEKDRITSQNGRVDRFISNF